MALQRTEIGYLPELETDMAWGSEWHAEDHPDWSEHWYCFEDAIIGFKPNTLSVHFLYRESRGDNDKVDPNPTSTGFLTRLTDTLELLALEYDFPQVEFDYIENPFLAGALERRGYTLLSRRFEDSTAVKLQEAIV